MSKSRLTEHHFTVKDILNSPVAHINQHLVANPVLKPKSSKYGNKRTEVNGIQFDSKREAKRYGELLLLVKAGEIGLLELQVPYELNTGGTHSLKYIADFVYLTKEGNKIVEDSKGMRTRDYLRKRKLMFTVHGIKIKET